MYSICVLYNQFNHYIYAHIYTHMYAYRRLFPSAWSVRPGSQPSDASTTAAHGKIHAVFLL